MQKQVKIVENKTSAKDVTKNNQQCRKAFDDLRDILKGKGLPEAPKGVSGKTFQDNLQGFRFDAQGRQGNRCHYALQQNGVKGKTNIMTITIEDINNQNDAKKLISSILSFDKTKINSKICYDFSI